MLRSLITSLLVIAWCISSAAGATPEPDTTAEKAQLLELLEEQTKLATKTRLNADYVPGIMTVLHGHDLEAKGVRTVWEALELVPGVTRTLSPGGNPQLIVRGVSDALSSGNVKILLNGVSVNSVQEGRANPVFSIPVEQVERIEFIRGPGSAVHGEYAYAGVLNLKTHENRNRVFAGIDGNDTRSAGALMSFDKGELHLGLSLSAWDSDGADVRTGRDALYQSQLPDNLDDYSHAPGKSNEKTASRTAVAKAEVKRLTLLGQWTERRAGDHFGTNYILPPEGRIVRTEQLKTLEVRYRAPVTAQLNTELYAGTVDTRTRKDDLYGGPSESYFSSGEPPVTVDSDYEEKRIYAGIDTVWQTNSHTLLLGLGFSDAEVEQHIFEANLDSTGVTEEKVDWSDTVTPPGTERDVLSLTLQDEFRASDDFTLTTGLRFDRYGQIGDSLAPRVAGVWRLDEHNIVKLQYGRAFRPPTLREQQFSSTELEPSSIDTIEAGYIHKDGRGERRVTVAYSELDDLVVFTPTDYYDNASARLLSSELEFRERLGRRFLTDGNLGFVHTEDSVTGEPLALTSRWFGNLGLQYRPAPETNADFRYRYVDGYAREQIDPRESAGGHGQLDVTLSRESRRIRGLTVRAGLHNALNEDVRYPALMAADFSGPIVSYPDDLPRDGRTWWFKLSYEY